MGEKRKVPQDQKWTVKAVRQWLLSKLYQLYDQYGYAAAVTFYPRGQGEESAPPFHLVEGVCETLENQGLVKIFGKSSDGSFSVCLTPSAYVMIRENREEEMERELKKRRKSIGFVPPNPDI